MKSNLDVRIASDGKSNVILLWKNQFLIWALLTILETFNYHKLSSRTIGRQLPHNHYLLGGLALRCGRTSWAV